MEREEEVRCTKIRQGGEKRAGRHNPRGTGAEIKERDYKLHWHLTAAVTNHHRFSG